MRLTRGVAQLPRQLLVVGPQVDRCLKRTEAGSATNMKMTNPTSFPCSGVQVSRPRSDHLRAGHDVRPVLPPGEVTQTPPKSLGAVGASVWKAIVKQGGPYVDTDALDLERYCQLYDRRAVLLALVDDEGYVVPGSMKQATAHPAIRLAHDIEAQMARLESVLALNPESRARLGIGADLPGDLTEFLAAG